LERHWKKDASINEILIIPFVKIMFNDVDSKIIYNTQILFFFSDKDLKNNVSTTTRSS